MRIALGAIIFLIFSSSHGSSFFTCDVNAEVESWVQGSAEDSVILITKDFQAIGSSVTQKGCNDLIISSGVDTNKILIKNYPEINSLKKGQNILFEFRYFDFYSDGIVHRSGRFYVKAR